MTVNLPNTLADIRQKVRRITGRPSAAQITDDQIDGYINTFYIYDMPEHLRLVNLRVNYQFLTQANIPVYDFPKDLYLTNMPPVFIAGYQSYMTQSRENFYRVNPYIQFLQQSVATGNGTAGPYNFTLTNTPIVRGFKPNPPGAYTGQLNDIQTKFINWGVLISGTDASGNSVSLIDDGAGNLVDVNDPFDPNNPSGPAAYTVRGTIDYITGVVAINGVGFPTAIGSGNAINAQYVPYVASRPQSIVYYQDQFNIYPIPDQAYTVSFEAYKYPTAFLSSASSRTPQLPEWWQLLAYGAADKIFTDNADFENASKFRPLMEEQMRLVQRRTIVQQTSERSASIYSEQSGFFQQAPFGNLFSGF